jgi:hypothetical protein
MFVEYHHSAIWQKKPQAAMLSSECVAHLWADFFSSAAS